MRGRLPWAYALVASILMTGSAVAEPMRAVVQLASESDVELLDRIRGQTVDLDLSLIPVQGAAPAPRVTRQLEVARKLARQHDARVVIWFRPLDDAGMIIYVAEPARDVVFVRRIPPRAPGPTARSATIETAALIIRTALRALAAGEHIGVTSAEAARAEAALEPEVPGAPEPRPAPEPARPLESISAPLRWHAGAAWQVVADGATTITRHAFTGRIGVARRRWHAAIAASIAPDVTLRDELTELEVGRYSAAIAAGVAPWRSRRAAMVIEVSASAVVYTRSTEVRAPHVTAAPPSRTVALALGTAVRYRWALGLRGLSLELHAAGDVVLGAPELGYDVAGRFVTRSAVWPVQPRVGLGLILQAF